MNPAIQIIDDARRNGLTYDQVIAHLADSGLHPEKAKATVDAYLKVKDSGGKERRHVNPGDPAWKP